VATVTSAWPPLPYEAWRPTKETLHRYCQMVGKVRMALTPARNHWWHATLYPATRGLTTGPMPAGDRYAEIGFDFVDHKLRLLSSDGREHAFELANGLACSSFYAQLFDGLDRIGLDVQIHAEPYDLGDSPPFAEDSIHDAYDADAVARFWQALGDTDRVLSEFAGRFNGKASPVHLFWHGFDLAHARYSGRRAPVAAEADRVTREAYSHEVVAFGFWPGDERTTPFPAYYSYTAPEPAGLSDLPLEPTAAQWTDTGNGSLAVLPYDAVRESGDPHRALLGFYESAYRAGAGAAAWDVDGFSR